MAGKEINLVISGHATPCIAADCQHIATQQRAQRVKESMQKSDQVTVTGTGYFGGCRREVRQLTRQLGAQYSGDLTYGVTTHLVCKDNLLSSREKVNVAHAWGIPIVQHAWLLDSVRQGTPLSVDTYCFDLNSSAAASLLPVCLAAQSSRQAATCHSTTRLFPCSDATQTNSSDMIEVEVLRKAAPVSCQLADLLVASPESPTAGMQQDEVHMPDEPHRAYSIMLCTAGSDVESKRWSEELDPVDLAPGMPPPSPVSPPVSTPDFSSGGHSTSSVVETSPTSAVHR